MYYAGRPIGTADSPWRPISPACNLLSMTERVQAWRSLTCYDCQVASMNRRIEAVDRDTRRKLRGRKP